VGRFNRVTAAALRTSTYFRLYHSESESFVQASSNAEKENLKNAASPNENSSSGGGSGGGGGSLYDSIDTQWSMTREGGDPPHIPFLKQLLDLGETPDPTDPKNQSTKSVWSFEYVKRSQCAPIGWGLSVRVRHVPSGRYLAVDREKSVYMPFYFNFALFGFGFLCYLLFFKIFIFVWLIFFCHLLTYCTTCRILFFYSSLYI
jgi:hypothetical protein